MDVRIINTTDGSHSLLNTPMNETYHSIHGAIQESRHIFINAGLNYFQEGHRGKYLRILEVGFGTGLNAFLTAEAAATMQISIYYTTLELFPLPASITEKLNYPQLVNFKDSGKCFADIHQAAWNVPVPINALMTIEKLSVDVHAALLELASYDVLYYDAFAPAKQPAMWEKSVLEKVCSTLKPGGILVTYCAKGQVKRDLRSVGMHVESLHGPPGKNEMVRATRLPHIQ